jgi:cation diffusion facilitator CzcD-associated flavoprotein CzcO
VKLNSRIISAQFDVATSKWKVGVSIGAGEEIKEEADVFINAAGILNQWKWPDIPGLEDFGGPKIHTANWVKHFSSFKPIIFNCTAGHDLGLDR